VRSPGPVRSPCEESGPFPLNGAQHGTRPPFGDGEVLGRLGRELGRLLLLVQDPLLGHHRACGRFDPHLLGRLRGLGEDTERLLQPHRVVLGREVLPPA
jgi:hypothetical protein